MQNILYSILQGNVPSGLRHCKTHSQMLQDHTKFSKTAGLKEFMRTTLPLILLLFSNGMTLWEIHLFTFFLRAQDKKINTTLMSVC